MYVILILVCVYLQIYAKTNKKINLLTILNVGNVIPKENSRIENQLLILD